MSLERLETHFYNITLVYNTNVLGHSCNALLQTCGMKHYPPPPNYDGKFIYVSLQFFNIHKQQVSNSLKDQNSGLWIKYPLLHQA